MTNNHYAQLEREIAQATQQFFERLTPMKRKVIKIEMSEIMRGDGSFRRIGTLECGHKVGVREGQKFATCRQCPHGYAPEHQAHVKELVDTFASTLKLECEKLYRSGGIDPNRFSPDEYALAKILVTAGIRRLADDFSPLHNKAWLADINNLVKM